MKILFDQGTPVPLRRALPSGSVTTVYEQGWSTLQNGALLAAAEQAGFDVFVTTDQNLKYQQQLTGRRMAILVLGSTSWPRIQRHSAAIWHVIEQLTPGSYDDCAPGAPGAPAGDARPGRADPR
jgi:hypothetical protein